MYTNIFYIFANDSNNKVGMIDAIPVMIVEMYTHTHVFRESVCVGMGSHDFHGAVTTIQLRKYVGPILSSSWFNRRCKKSK